jgi:hypothetical protein
MEKQTPKKPRRIGDGTPGPGRPKGVPNKNTTLLKDAILEAATKAGGRAGLVGYLKQQAEENPGPFMALLGKVLPMQISGPGENGEHLVATLDPSRMSTKALSEFLEAVKPNAASEGNAG